MLEHPEHPLDMPLLFVCKLLSHFAVIFRELLPSLKYRWPFSTCPIPTLKVLPYFQINHITYRIAGYFCDENFDFRILCGPNFGACLNRA